MSKAQLSYCHEEAGLEEPRQKLLGRRRDARVRQEGSHHHQERPPLCDHRLGQVHVLSQQRALLRARAHDFEMLAGKRIKEEMDARLGIL